MPHNGMVEHRATAERAANAPDVAVIDGPVMDVPVIDGAVIDQLASITDGQGLSVLSELLQAFLAAAPTRLEALDHAVGAGDLLDVAHQAHALTGSSASFGAARMAAVCRRLRAAAEEGDRELTPALVLDLHAEYARVRVSLMALARGPR